jgi:hypothetical protein
MKEKDLNFAVPKGTLFQGDQIGQVFDLWPILLFGQFHEKYKFWDTFFHSKG